MGTTFDRWWLWVVANLIGMALFLHLAVQTWIEPELVKAPGASGGEFIVWGISALPVFLIFMLAHFGFGIAADRNRSRNGSWRGDIGVGITFVLWVAVFLYDNAHHGISTPACGGERSVGFRETGSALQTSNMALSSTDARARFRH